LIILSASSLIFCSKLKIVDASNFCWKDTKTRGVGQIPNKCPEKRELVGLLCYTPCPKGYKRVGVDCHQICPSGWTDHGLLCNNGKVLAQLCQNLKLGFAAGLSPSCPKSIIIGDPVIRNVCPGKKEYNAGLCYDPCTTGYFGIGPVCWGQVPKGWVECGMGAAKDSSTCGDQIIAQVGSVGTLILNIATLGTSAALGKASDAAVKVKKMKDNFEKVKTSVENGKKIFDKFKTKNELGDKLKSLGNDVGKASTDEKQALVTSEDIARKAAELISLIDPSGVSGVIAAYTFPKCSKIFPKV
jgi:hypothetical protein